MLIPLSRRRVLQRLENPALRFIYIVAQPGAGVSQLLYEFARERTAASISFAPQVDRYSPDEFARYLQAVRRPTEPRVVVATASDPSTPQPFMDARPGELCIITDDDLAMTPQDIVEFFRQNAVEIGLDAARRVYALTGGWAAGTAYVLRQWKAEGEIAACNPRSRSNHALRVYVHERMLSRLSIDELGALVTTVAIAGTEPEILRHALPAANVEVALASLERRRLLLRSNGTLAVPAIFAETVSEQYHGDLRSLGAQIADDLAQSGNYEGAARVSFSTGSPQRGVDFLLKTPLETLLARRIGFQKMLRSLSDAVLCAHPKLWLASILERRYRIDLRVLIAEAQTLLAIGDENSDATTNRLIKSSLEIALVEAGEFEAALSLENDLSCCADNAPSLAEAIVAGNKSSALSLVGHFAQALRELQSASQFLARSPMLLSLFTQVQVRKARVEGNWFAEKAFHERAIVAARESADECTVAMCLMEAAFGAFVAGDRVVLERFMECLRALGDSVEIAPFAAFARIGQGTRMDADKRFGLPRLRGIAHLFHAAAAASVHECRAQLTAAMDEFDESGYLFGRVLTRVALAQVVPHRQEPLIAQAKAFAAEMEVLPLRGSLSHLAIGELPAHDQPLRRFAEHMRAFREPLPAPLTVSILKGVIERDGRTLDISPKVFLLFAALHVRGRPLEREELCEMLWPDTEPQEAVNALKMTVRRARLQCGDSNAVRWTNNAYVLGDEVHVDLDHVKQLCESAVKDAGVIANRRSELYAMYELLVKGRQTCLLQQEWFVGTEAVLTRLQMELGEALAGECIRRADFACAGALSDLMLQCDPCDETAWELIIRAHLSAGQRELASRALREYRRLAAAQLQTTPSARIENLLA